MRVTQSIMPHIHEKIDFCSEVLVVFEDTVLLRMHDKYGIWLSVGGHIERDEDPSQAAVREVKEEVGIDVELVAPYAKRSGSNADLLPPRFVNRHRISEAHEHVAFVFFARALSQDLHVPVHEHAECRWFNEAELDDPKFKLSPDLRHYARTALRELALKP